MVDFPFQSSTSSIRYFNKFDDEDDLYENNSKNLSIAYYSKYNNYNIIHAVGPNFNNSNYLTNIIDNKNIELLYKLFYKIYLDIYIEFYSSILLLIDHFCTLLFVFCSF